MSNQTVKRLRDRLVENTRLRSELESVARARDALIATLQELRGQHSATCVRLMAAEGARNDSQRRLQRLMDAAVSGESQRLHEAVLYEVRCHWRRDS